MKTANEAWNQVWIQARDQVEPQHIVVGAIQKVKPRMIKNTGVM